MCVFVRVFERIVLFSAKGNYLCCCSIKVHSDKGQSEKQLIYGINTQYTDMHMRVKLLYINLVFFYCNHNSLPRYFWMHQSAAKSCVWYKIWEVKRPKEKERNWSKSEANKQSKSRCRLHEAAHYKPTTKAFAVISLPPCSSSPPSPLRNHTPLPFCPVHAMCWLATFPSSILFFSSYVIK